MFAVQIKSSSERFLLRNQVRRVSEVLLSGSLTIRVCVVSENGQRVGEAKNEMDEGPILSPSSTTSSLPFPFSLHPLRSL